MNMEEYIKHHGVKGMKWGVRKSRTKGGSGVAKKVGSKATKAAKAVADHFNPKGKYTMTNYRKDHKELSKKVRDKSMTRLQAITERKNNRHKVNMNNLVYSKTYTRLKSKGKSERVARTIADKSRKVTNKLAIGVTVGAAASGSKVAAGLIGLALAPDAVRIGKNLVKRVKKAE